MTKKENYFIKKRDFFLKPSIYPLLVLSFANYLPDKLQLLLMNIQTAFIVDPGIQTGNLAHLCPTSIIYRS